MRTLPATLPRPRDVSGEFGIYVHVPFCSHRCFYCDFNAYAELDHLAPAYMAALARDAREALSAPEGLLGAERPTVTSVFIGGGTPSLVDASALTGVVEAIRDSWPLSPEAEVTVECNPESATPDKLVAYRRAGINRVSFGVQSLHADLLARLGRVHDADTALRALRAARDAGFESVNADLIFGIPGEDDDAWRASLDGVLAAGVTHLSCYGLTYEEGTPLHAWRRLGKIVPVPDDDAARRWEMADAVLSAAGLERYEISNWARPGEASRHNRLYWACGEYLGIGAGAHGHLAAPAGARRSWTVRSPERYLRMIDAGRRPVAGSEDVDVAGRAAEVMFLGLRRSEGVDADGFASLTGWNLEQTFGPELSACAREGLLVWDGRAARLTSQGTLLANEVVSRFLSPE